MVSTSLVTLWGIGALAGWSVLEGGLPLALVFLLNSPAGPVNTAVSGAMGFMQPRMIPILALLFFDVFYAVAKYGFPGSGIEQAWRGWLVIPVWGALLAQLVLEPGTDPAGCADETAGHTD